VERGGDVAEDAAGVVPGGAAGATGAASWLFGLFMAAPLLAAFAIRRLPLQVRPAAAE